MTRPIIDRRTRIQSHPINMVVDAINNNVYGDDNRRIMKDLFINNRTYEDVACQEHLSVRGLYKRVEKISTKIEKVLN